MSSNAVNKLCFATLIATPGGIEKKVNESLRIGIGTLDTSKPLRIIAAENELLHRLFYPL